LENVLVTGGAGYIGSHTCKALSQAGYQPVVLDNLVYGHDWAVKWGPLEVFDTSDSAAIEAVIERYKPIAAIHFAAYAYVGESVTNPAKYYRNNVIGTIKLLDALYAGGVDKLIFSSTCATYGIPDGKTISELQLQRPINPYGHTKLMVEQILRDYDAAYGLRSIALRYFNAAGADPDCEIGENHNPETHLIPLVLDAAGGKRDNITIFGTDYDTPDGTCVRDYIHVTDLAAAHLLALEMLKNGNKTDAYNVGVGHGWSVREVIDAARRLTGKKIEVVEGERRPGDPPFLVAESNRIRDEFGWEPSYSALDSIIETAWSWHQKTFTND